jgi:hypothetical protein
MRVIVNQGDHPHCLCKPPISRCSFMIAMKMKSC